MIDYNKFIDIFNAITNVVAWNVSGPKQSINDDAITRYAAIDDATTRYATHDDVTTRNDVGSKHDDVATRYATNDDATTRHVTIDDAATWHDATNAVTWNGSSHAAIDGSTNGTTTCSTKEQGCC